MLPDWIGRLESKYENWTIPNLAQMIVGLNAGVFMLTMIKPEFPGVLTLSPHLIIKCEVWRALTFLFIPPTMAPLWMFFWLYLLYTYATALEGEWGEFSFNLFYAIGAVSTVTASMLMGVGLSNVPLNSTLFLAFAALYPDFELRLFFILPVKVKWLAWLVWAGLALSFLLGGFYAKAALLAGLLNYGVFFGKHHWEEAQLWLQVRRNRRRYKDAFKDKDE